MIALIAAVPLETDLLRRALSPCEVRSCGRLDLLRGTLDGQPVGLLHCGIGKANAAAAAAVLLETVRPRAVFNLGCGGAYPDSALGIGDLAIASEEVFGDEGVVTPETFLDMEALGLPLLRRNGQSYFNRFPVDKDLLQRAKGILEAHTSGSKQRLAVGPFVTVSTCSGTTAAGRELSRRTRGICENMEGAAIAQTCIRFGTPFLELRGISNRTEDRDLSRWDLRAGAAAAQHALRTLLGHWYQEKDPA